MKYTEYKQLDMTQVGEEIRRYWEEESWGQKLLYTKYSLKHHNGNWSIWQTATNTTWAKARAATRVVRSTRFTEACAIWLATRMGMPPTMSLGRNGHAHRQLYVLHRSLYHPASR